MKRTKFITSLLILALTLTGCSLFKKKQPAEPAKKPPINEPLNVIDLGERPYLTLQPRNDGRQITLSIDSLPKPATEMEYELEYQAGTLLQGAFGSLALDDLPTSTDILLGSCSAGGACSYHQDVTGGTIILKFRGEENYVLKNEWRFIETDASDGAFSSRDGKFQLSAAKTLDNSNIVIISQTSGLPGDFEGEILSGPYGLYPSQGLPDSKQASLDLRIAEEDSKATIYGWDGQTWVAFDTSVTDKTASATVDLLEVYIAAR